MLPAVTANLLLESFAYLSSKLMPFDERSMNGEIGLVFLEFKSLPEVMGSA
jgi:hypothetical protein